MDFHSLKPHKTLYPYFFDKNETMRFPIRKRLLKIAKLFWKSLGLKIYPQDIVLTGSMANYNYSNDSDIDIHILVPFSKINQDVELVEKFMTAKKNEWNTLHNIKLLGHTVEIYVQNNEDDDLIAGGVYSIFYNVWLKHPDVPDVNLNYNKIRRYIFGILRAYREIKKLYELGRFDGLYGRIKNLVDKIYQMRQFGLERGGEFSSENMAFKMLRRDKVMDNLQQMQNMLYDKRLSVPADNVRRFAPRTKKFNFNKKEKDSNKQGLGRYIIAGKRFVSLRKAEKVLGIPKSTIEYRLKSKSPKYANYRILAI